MSIFFPWICKYSLIVPNSPSNLNSKKEFNIQMHLRILHVYNHLEDCTAICILKTWVAHPYGHAFCVFDIIIIDYLKILKIKWLAHYKTMTLGNFLRYGALKPTIPLMKKKKKKRGVICLIFPFFPSDWLHCFHTASQIADQFFILISN